MTAGTGCFPSAVDSGDQTQVIRPMGKCFDLLLSHLPSPGLAFEAQKRFHFDEVQLVYFSYVACAVLGYIQ